MSDHQAIWTILWNHAKTLSRPSDPFEIDEILPQVVKTLGIPEPDARRKVGLLLGELERLPEGRQFFAREGNAVVPLSGFLRAKDQFPNPVEAYPYEL